MPLAVITGGTKGIGKAIAEIFIKNGFDLAICSRTIKDLTELKTKWEREYSGRRIFIKEVDVQDKNSIDDFANLILKHFPEVNVLVNNAGIFLPGNIMDEAEGHFEMMMYTNLFSVYHLCRKLVPKMVEQGFGHIFNLSSIAATKAYPNGGSYSISKHGLIGLSDNLRYELMDKNVKVTALTPGAVWTDSWKESGVKEDRIMKSDDLAEMVWAAFQLSRSTVVENIIFRPQLGDL